MRGRSGRVCLRVRVGMSLIAAVLLAAAGCGGDDESSGEPARAKEQVLRVNYGTEPPSLDPGLVTDVTSANVVNAILDPLVKLGEELEPVGAIADSWDISEDGKTVTFKLRDDGKWTNGDPVTAQDFEWSWKRTISPELAADYAYQFYGIVGAQEYNGCDAKKQQCEQLRDKVGVKALNAQTLEVQLTTPQPWFVQQSAHTSFMPVHRPTVEKHGENWTDPANIVTNGPFRLAEWKHDDSLTLEKWDEWRAADEVELERVEGRMINDATTALQAFEAGEIDACLDRASCVPTEELERLKDTDDYVQAEALATMFIGVNVKNIPDVNQRRALAFALDRQSIVDNVTKADETPATSFTPKGMPGFDSIRQDFLPETADLARAKEFLAQAKNPKQTIRFVTNNDASSRELAVAIQSMWAEIGLKTTIRTMEWAQFLEFIGPPPNESVDVFWIGWIGDYVDDMNFLDLWTCKGGINSTGFCDPAYDRLVEQARRTIDDDERHGLYTDLEARLTSEDGAMVVIPVYWATQVVLRKEWVEGWEPNLLGMFDYTKVSVGER